MEREFEVASLDIQDIRVLIVFLDQAADARSYAALERAARDKQLEGELVLVWPDQIGRTRFLAHAERHAFFQVADYDQLRAQINGSLVGSLA